MTPLRSPSTRHAEAIVVGAGPIGLELAVALRSLDVDFVHLDAGQIGQTVSWYPPQTTFFSSPERIAIAGVPLVTPDQSKATREQYLAYLRGVVEQFDLRVNTYEKVVRIERDDEGNHVVDTERIDGEAGRYVAPHLVLAVGDMHGPRRLGIPGEDLPHVSHYFDDPHKYFRRKLLIVGGRNSAAEAALRCHRAGAEVAISYRGENFEDNGIKYWLLPELNSLVRTQQIAFHPRTIPTEIAPGRTTLRRVEADGKTANGEAFDVDSDFVLLLTGYAQDKSLFEMAGVTLDGENRAPRHDPETMACDAPGVFVAGTAAAGTQEKFKLFIENCHRHVHRIATAIAGRPPESRFINTAVETLNLPES
ncbi:MAG: NAD(P)-binding domain-containing protein [Phycisphaeraceae bacterium]